MSVPRLVSFCNSAAIDSVQHHCKPSGFVLIEYWDRSSWLAKALGKHWHEYSPPSVVHWFNQADLDLLMQNHGFNHRVSGRPKKYIDSRHVKSLLAFKTAGGWADRPVAAVLRTIPDGATLRHPCFDLFWTLYQCRG